MMPHVRPTLLLASLLLLAACGRKPAAPAPSPTDEPSVTGAPSSSGSADDEAAARAEAERAARDRAEREAKLARLRATIEERIHFAYDRSDLTADARATLDAKLALLQANPSLRIRVSGHTDERGSDEYNMALGQRRAAAAKRYLMQRGIAAERIEVVSFGEERPACEASVESCWGQNRRDDFEAIDLSAAVTGRP